MTVPEKRGVERLRELLAEQERCHDVHGIDSVQFKRARAKYENAVLDNSEALLAVAEAAREWDESRQQERSHMACAETAWEVHECEVCARHRDAVFALAAAVNRLEGQ